MKWPFCSPSKPGVVTGSRGSRVGPLLGRWCQPVPGLRVTSTPAACPHPRPPPSALPQGEDRGQSGSSLLSQGPRAPTICGLGRCHQARPTPTGEKTGLSPLDAVGLVQRCTMQTCVTASLASHGLPTVRQAGCSHRRRGTREGTVGWCPQDVPVERSGREGLERSGSAGEAVFGAVGRSGASALGGRRIRWSSRLSFEGACCVGRGTSRGPRKRSQFRGRWKYRTLSGSLSGTEELGLGLE